MSTKTKVSELDRRRPARERSPQVRVRRGPVLVHSKLTGPNDSHVKVLHTDAVSSDVLQAVLDRFPADSYLGDVEAALQDKNAWFEHWADGTPGHSPFWRVTPIRRSPTTGRPRRRWRKTEKTAVAAAAVTAVALLGLAALGARK